MLSFLAHHQPVSIFTDKMQLQAFTPTKLVKGSTKSSSSSSTGVRPVLCSAISQPQARVTQHKRITSSVCTLHSSSSTRLVARTAAPAAAASAAAADTGSDNGLRSAAIALAKTADDTKALDISVLHVEPIVSWTSYMLLCTVMSKPQLLAVLSRMEDAAAEHGLEKQNSSGSSQWEVLDFGSIVCHVFTAEQREYYNLDDFYALAEEVELPFVSATAAMDGGYEQQQYGSGADSSSGSSIGGLWSKSL